MHVQSKTLEETLNQPSRYVIPVFQRFYSWQKAEWEQIWEDITELGKIADHNRHHFMGPLVFAAEQSIPGKYTAYRVIDGQQRLITLSLLLCALRDVAEERAFDSMSKEIQDSYLVHPYRHDNERFRVYPRQRDRKQYLAAIEQNEVDAGNVGEALSYFKREIGYATGTEEEMLELLDTVRKRVDFVHIILTQENPFQIFKSLNSTGVDLNECDLIRNFVFMNVGENEQDNFDDNFWKPLERHFEFRDSKQKGLLNTKEFTTFLRASLMRDGAYVGVNSVFEDFEARYKVDFNAQVLMQELNSQAVLYDVIRGRSQHPSGEKKIDAALSQLRGLESSTTDPLVLNLLNRLDNGNMSSSDVIYCLQLISGFVLRRYICSESSRAYGKLFVAACAALKDVPMENLKEFLISKTFPDDATFQEAFQKFPIYEGNYCFAILKELELFTPYKERGPLPPAQAVQIEHIMPRTLTNEWRNLLGNKADEIHMKWLDTVGNLTITRYNAELANKPFLEKRKHYAGSGYLITRDLNNSTTWGENQIIQRGKRLSETAKQIWIGPNS